MRRRSPPGQNFVLIVDRHRTGLDAGKEILARRRLGRNEQVKPVPMTSSRVQPVSASNWSLIKVMFAPVSITLTR